MYVRLIGELSIIPTDLFDWNEDGVKKSCSARLYVMVRAGSAAETIVHPEESSRAATFAKNNE